MILYRKLPDQEIITDINTFLYLSSQRRLQQLTDSEEKAFEEITEGMAIFSALRALKLISSSESGPIQRRRF